MAGKAGPFRRRPHQPGRCLPDRLHLRHHRRAQSDNAFSPRRAGDVRDLRPAHGAGRPRSRSSPARRPSPSPSAWAGFWCFRFISGPPSPCRKAQPPRPWRKPIARHRATHLFTSPTAYRAMTARKSEFDLSSLKRLRLGGRSACPRRFPTVVRGHRPSADRRHRRHRDDSYLHLRHRR